MARTKLLPVIPMVVAGIVLVVYGTSRTELSCERPAQTCTWRDGILGGGGVTFPMSDVAEIRLVDNYGRHGNDGHVELRRTSGDVMAFGRGERAQVAARMTSETKQFFAADGTRLHFAAPTLAWMCFLGFGLLLGALVIILAVKRGRSGNSLRALAVAAGLVGIGGSIATCAMRADPGLTVSG